MLFLVNNKSPLNQKALLPPVLSVAGNDLITRIIAELEHV